MPLSRPYMYHKIHKKIFWLKFHEYDDSTKCKAQEKVWEKIEFGKGIV
jgi:hypothetical protein